MKHQFSVVYGTENVNQNVKDLKNTTNPLTLLPSEAHSTQQYEPFTRGATTFLTLKQFSTSLQALGTHKECPLTTIE